jgi:soluble lytic murein transglycosylase-like protein
MKKFILTLFLLFSVISLSNIVDSKAEQTVDDVSHNEILEHNRLMTEKIAELQKELYMKDLIQYIEFDAEIIIPEYFENDYIEYTYNTATNLNIPTRLAFRLMYTESRFKDSAISPVGASGLMQLMPDTRKMYYDLLAVDTLNLDKNREDIYIGLNLLNDLHDFWKSRGNSDSYSWKLALASYNAGKGNVLKYKGIPPFKETQNFVAFINKAHSNPEFLANYSKKYENTLKANT